MTDKTEIKTTIVHQLVSKDAYKVIKSIAALENRLIKDVVNEAFIFFAENRKVKKWKDYFIFALCFYC